MRPRSDDALATEEGRLDALLDAVDQPTDLVGRRSDIVAVASRLRPGRVLTVTGPGGVGKTVLADAIGEMVAPLFEDSWRCDLGAALDRDAVEAELADRIGTFRGENASVLDAVVEALRDRRALLVLDNVEQVVGAAAGVIGYLLEECDGLVVLATSRVSLGIAREDVWTLAPLNIEGDAPDLFIALAATRVAPDAIRAPGARQAIIDICGDLDGLPLALELAAAQLPELSLEQIRDRLDQRFRMLRDPDRPDRQATLVAAVRWSYDLLEPAERNLFDRLSVFQGGFDEAGARAVLGPDAIRTDVEVMLHRLEMSSMVVRRVEHGRTRYELLETLRQFGDRQLAERGARATVRNAHLDHLVAVSAAAGSRCHGPEWSEGVTDFVSDWGNLRAALQWAVDTQRTSDVDRLLRDVFFMSRWSVESEPGTWAQRALDRAAVTDVQLGAPAHLHRGFAEFLAGRHDAALAANEQALSVSSTPVDRSWARLYAAIELLYAGRTDDAARTADLMVAEPPPRPVEQAMQGSARPVFKLLAGQMDFEDAMDEALRMRDLAIESGSPVALGHVLYNIGMLRYTRGEVDQATALFQQVLDIGREHSVNNLVGYVLISQVYAPGRTGLRASLDALRSWEQRSDVGNEFVVLEGLGINLAELGRHEPAAVILGHLDEGGRRIASSLQRREAAGADISLHRRSDRWGARGRAMTRAQLIAYAREQADAALATL